MGFSLHVCLHIIFSSYKDTSHTGLGPTVMTSSQLCYQIRENTKAMVRPLTRHVTLHKSLKLVRSGLHDLQTAELEETYGASVNPESVFCHFLSLSWDPMP